MRGLVPDREERNGEEVVSREVLMKWADSFCEIKNKHTLATRACCFANAHCCESCVHVHAKARKHILMYSSELSLAV